jgi:hypothetical protein
MADITTVLRQNINQITGEIKQLQAQRSALQTALESIGTGDQGTTRRRRTGSPRPAGRPRRTARPRRKRGANQKAVLNALAQGNPRRLTEIASDTGLRVTATGSVLRGLITKKLVAKSGRGTYLLRSNRRARA